MVRKGEINMNMVLKYNNLKEKTNQGKILTSFGKDLSTFVAEGKKLVEGRTKGKYQKKKKNQRKLAVEAGGDSDRDSPSIY